MKTTPTIIMPMVITFIIAANSLSVQIVWLAMRQGLICFETSHKCLTTDKFFIGKNK